MSVSLYSHQLEALDKMKNGCILCGGVGSGKSRTALAYYYTQYGGIIDDISYVRMSDDENLPDLYIITTARKRDTKEWELDMAPFLLSTKKENNLYSNTVVVDSWNNIGKYVDVKDAFFIFDEQRVVGSGEWVKSFLKITKANKWILLSATPGDKWEDYIPVFIANGFYKNRTEFKRDHCSYTYTGQFYKLDRYLNTGKLVRLRRSILVDMNFNRKTEAHHEDVHVDYDILQYKSVVRNRWDPFEEKPIENVSDYCAILRRISNSHISRLENLLRIIKHKDKVIIFYNFNFELDSIIEYLSNAKSNGDLYSDFEIAEWNGRKHQPLPESSSWAYLVQYNAGAEGWNCITTDTIIFYSQTYSYRMLVQAAGRIDRLNTPFKDLYYYHFRSSSPIDIAIHRALSNKKQFNEGAFARKNYSAHNGT